MNTGEILMLVGDIMIALGLAVLCFLLFVWVVSRVLERQINRTLNEVAEDLAQNRLIPLMVEQYGDQYFCYHSFTKDFVCQGVNLEEIISKFKARYPNKAASLHNGDETALEKLKQQLREIKNENSNSVRHPS
jgi:hypothetical protein